MNVSIVLVAIAVMIMVKKMKIKKIDCEIKKELWTVFFDNGTKKEFHSRTEYKSWADNNFRAVEEHLQEGVLKREEHYRGKRR